ncbi:hypothetical protein RFI_14954, partial [Reticulomyxa filosa]
MLEDTKTSKHDDSKDAAEQCSGVDHESLPESEEKESAYVTLEKEKIEKWIENFKMESLRIIKLLNLEITMKERTSESVTIEWSLREPLGDKEKSSELEFALKVQKEDIQTDEQAISIRVKPNSSQKWKYCVTGLEPNCKYSFSIQPCCSSSIRWPSAFSHVITCSTEGWNFDLLKFTNCHPSSSSFALEMHDTLLRKTKIEPLHVSLAKDYSVAKGIHCWRIHVCLINCLFYLLTSYMQLEPKGFEFR